MVPIVKPLYQCIIAIPSEVLVVGVGKDGDLKSIW
jgi:hypothetical protein